MELPWKIFVRESECIEDEASKQSMHMLKFQGDEAKLAYENIVKQEYPLSSIEKRKQNVAFNNSVKNHSISSGHILNKQTKKHQTLINSGQIVCANAILKAVEQCDLKFLQTYVKPENVNLCDDFGWTPLMSAAYCGQIEIVKYLLSLGANIIAKEKSGLTAARLALKKNHFNIVALLKSRHVSCPGPIPEKPEQQKVEQQEHQLDILKTNVVQENKIVLKEKDEISEFYCEICKTTFYETKLKAHESSTLHIFNSKPKLKSVMYTISKQNKGYQMLLNTGWDEETGLGPSGKGMKYPIKATMKIDRKGIGHSKEKDAKLMNTNFINVNPTNKQKSLRKKDREKLLSFEAQKDRAIRIALS
ncbi:G patch domain and ankyrin repeat-containing protein 1 homolog [Prorops nasuta]|uniref:G patch domain and ankyrin repeat-containing protein 1 homolog n=1 Tax=Prorops nasuta TaxID=863751 RepID=UPI0034CEFCB1